MKRMLLLAVALCTAWGVTAQPRLHVGPNEPIGEPVGINKGRVAWIHNPGVATWDGETGFWVEERWNDQQKADAMVRQAVMTLAGKKSPRLPGRHSSRTSTSATVRAMWAIRRVRRSLSSST